MREGIDLLQETTSLVERARDDVADGIDDLQPVPIDVVLVVLHDESPGIGDAGQIAVRRIGVASDVCGGILHSKKVAGVEPGGRVRTEGRRGRGTDQEHGRVPLGIGLARHLVEDRVVGRGRRHLVHRRRAII